jgi:DNA-binding NarL/FixJ family response regulator
MMIRVLVVDDDPFFRESLKLILDMNGAIEVAGTCTDGAEAARFVEQDGHIDLVLMDIRMPGCDGVEGTKRIKAQNPDTAVLILTTFDDDEYILEALRNGAGGYMLKNIPPDRIMEGIKTVHQGSMLIHPDIAKKLAGLLNPAAGGGTGGAGGSRAGATAAGAATGGHGPIGSNIDYAAGQPGANRLEGLGLTPAEQSVVEKIADGLSNKEIAQTLFLSEGTVKNYITEILAKLALRDRTQIAIFYWKHD